MKMVITSLIAVRIKEHNGDRGTWLELPLCKPSADFEKEFKAWLEDEGFEGTVDIGETGGLLAYFDLGWNPDLEDVEELNSLAWQLEDFDGEQIDAVCALIEADEADSLEEAIELVESGNY